MLSSSSSSGSHSQLYNAILSYLHNQNRVQPIIGLNSITEVLTYCQPALYFCDVCFLRLAKPDIRNHIMGSIHRYNYIKSHHACGWRSYTDLTLLARPLMDIAKMVEKREGTGDVQVLCVDEVIYNEMTSFPVSDAFAQMNRVKNQQNDLSEGQQVSGYRDVTTQCKSTTPKCASDPQTVSTDPILNASSSRTASPVKALSKCQEASEPQSLVDSHDSFRISCLERSPALGQHISQDQPVVIDRCQSLHLMPSDNRCLTETRSISVASPPRQGSPIRIDFQNNTLHASEEDGDNVMHAFGVRYDSYPMHLVQNTPYEAHLQTPVSNMVPQITQSLTNRSRFVMNESSPDSPEPVRDLEITSVHELIRTQMITQALETDPTHNSNQSRDEADPQQPIDIKQETCEEAQSDDFEEQDTQNPVSQFPVAQSQSLSDQDQSLEDFLENYKGRKPLIGLQAVIKCESIDGNPPPCCYLCQLCSLKLKKRKIFRHLTSCDHQRNYLKVLHPQLLPKKRKRCNTNEMLEDIAIRLEKEDGRGQIKVMRLSACLISDALHKNYQWCMNVLNCGAGVGWRSDLLSFKDRTDKTTCKESTVLIQTTRAVFPKSIPSTINFWEMQPSSLFDLAWQTSRDSPKCVWRFIHHEGGGVKRFVRQFEDPMESQGPSQTLKRPAESLLPPSEKRPIRAPNGPPTHQRPPKMKGHPKQDVRTTKVKNPVFKVSLSLQEGPVVIERTSLRDTITVAPEIETQSCNDDATNTLSEVQTCNMYRENAPLYPDGDVLAPALTCTHTQALSHTDSRFMNPAQYERPLVIHKVEASLRPKEVVAVTYADWPGQNWSFYNNEWIGMRQNQYGIDRPECAGYMRY